jgi:hypothetical protein
MIVPLIPFAKFQSLCTPCAHFSHKPALKFARALVILTFLLARVFTFDPKLCPGCSRGFLFVHGSQDSRLCRGVVC